MPTQLRYEVRCDAGWSTVMASVDGWIGSDAVSSRIEVDVNGRWRLNGAEVPALDGCVDVDLNFSPSTNLLPIRRLQLSVHEEARVRAAWLRFPEFTLEPLEQSYRRAEAGVYRYRSGDGSFVRDLQVDATGLVTDYPGFWTAEPLAGPHGA